MDMHEFASKESRGSEKHDKEKLQHLTNSKLSGIDCLDVWMLKDMLVQSQKKIRNVLWETGEREFLLHNGERLAELVSTVM